MNDIAYHRELAKISLDPKRPSLEIADSFAKLENLQNLYPLYALELQEIKNALVANHNEWRAEKEGWNK